MVAIILAAGESSRFWPLAKDKHKAFYRLGSGKTILEYTIENLLENKELKEIVLVVSPRDQVLAKEIFSSNKQVRLLVQEKPSGQGDAILLARSFLEKSEHFFVTIANKVNAGEVFAKLSKVKSEAIALKTEEQLSDYGTVRLDGEKIVEVIEKPKPDQVKVPIKITSGYILGQTFLPFLEKLSGNHYSLELALNEYVQNHKVVGFKVDDLENTTLKYPWHLFDLNRLLQKNLTKKISPKAEISKTAEISGPVIIEEGVKIHNFVKIVGPVYIGRDSIIGDYTSLRDNTFIGEGVIIGSHSEIKNSIIYNGVHTHRNYLGDSIIDEGVKIGAGTITANKRLDRKEIIKSGLTSLGVIIGKEAKLGINVNLMPGVKIGAGAGVFPGITVYKDIPDLETFRG